MTMVKLTFDGPVANLTMDDGKGNALGTDMLAEMDAALYGALSANVVVLRGREKVFCGGLHLPALVGLSRAEMNEFLVIFERVFHKLLAYPRPIIAVARGSAVAGGAILLCSGDRRLVTPAGKVGISEVTLGLSFPTSALELVRVALGEERAWEAATVGKLYEGMDRQRIGFATEVVEPDRMDARAAEMAGEYAALDAEASGRIRLQLRRAAIDRSIANMESDRSAFLDRWFSPNAQIKLRQVVERLAAR